MEIPATDTPLTVSMVSPASATDDIRTKLCLASILALVNFVNSHGFDESMKRASVDRTCPKGVRKHRDGRMRLVKLPSRTKQGHMWHLAESESAARDIASKPELADAAADPCDDGDCRSDQDDLCCDVPTSLDDHDACMDDRRGENHKDGKHQSTLRDFFCS